MGLGVVRDVRTWVFVTCADVCCSRWSFASEAEDLPVGNLVTGNSAGSSNGTEDTMIFQGYILK